MNEANRDLFANRMAGWDHGLDVEEADVLGVAGDE